MLQGIKKLLLRAMNKKVDHEGLAEKSKGDNSSLRLTEGKKLYPPTYMANLSKGLGNKRYLLRLTWTNRLISKIILEGNRFQLFYTRKAFAST